MDHTVTEIDATYFGAHRKCVGGAPRGRQAKPKRCLYVAVERGDTGRSQRIAVDLAPGPNENQASAEAFARHITRWTHLVESDAGAAFANLGSVLNATHHTVPHCRTFVTKTGTHSQTVEGRNMLIKKWVKIRCGTAYNTSDDVLLFNLAQYTWEQWCTDSSGTLQYTMFLFAHSGSFCIATTTRHNHKPNLNYYTSKPPPLC
jgi:hypothetical protein